MNKKELINKLKEFELDKEDLTDIILDHFYNGKYNHIDLSGLDFGSSEVDLSSMKAKIINNSYQKAKQCISNNYQKADRIYNSEQSADKIDNKFQKANEIIKQESTKW